MSPLHVSQTRNSKPDGTDHGFVVSSPEWRLSQGRASIFGLPLADQLVSAMQAVEAARFAFLVGLVSIMGWTEMTQSQPDYRLKNPWQQAAEAICTVSLFGAMLWIANGFVEYMPFLPSFLRFDDNARAWADAWMAIVSIVLIVALTYAKPHQRNPDKVSLYILAPLALVVAIGSGAFMIFIAKKVVPDIISGLSLLGLSAGLARTLPFSSLPNQ